MNGTDVHVLGERHSFGHEAGGLDQLRPRILLPNRQLTSSTDDPPPGYVIGARIHDPTHEVPAERGIEELPECAVADNLPGRNLLH